MKTKVELGVSKRKNKPCFQCDYFQLGKVPCQRGNTRDPARRCPDYKRAVYRGDPFRFGKNWGKR
jgi:hypothetical protein